IRWPPAISSCPARSVRWSPSLLAIASKWTSAVWAASSARWRPDMEAKRVKRAILPGNGLAVPDIERIDAADGSFILRSRQAPRKAARCVGDWLEHWSASTPNALFLAERSADGESWRKLTYSETRRSVGRIAQALLDMGLVAQAPVVILSDNSVDV